MPDRDPHDSAPTREPVYRLILALMTADIVLGLALAAVGEFVLRQRPITLAGLGLGLVGALLLVFFQRLGARAERGR
jgi:hypothetical protein